MQIAGVIGRHSKGSYLTFLLQLHMIHASRFKTSASKATIRKIQPILHTLKIWLIPYTESELFTNLRKKL